MAAHCGAAGHRGMGATRTALQTRFWWKNLTKDVDDFCLQCLHCVTTRGGSRVPRPMGNAVHAGSSNAVLHWDFLFIQRAVEGTSRHGYSYILVIKDGYDSYVELVPCIAASTPEAVAALIEWFKRYGIVPVWVSDQGTHFKNKVVADLCRQLKCKQEFVVAYSPFANGTVERVNRVVLAVLRALLSEWKLSFDDWPYVLPVVMMAINMSPVRRLGNLSPIEVRTGRPLAHPLDVIVTPTLGGVVSTPVDAEEIVTRVKELVAALEVIHESVLPDEERSNVADNRREVNINWGLGDYVLMARVSKAADNKLVAKWRGPMHVKEVVNPWVYRVADLITDNEWTVHAERLRYYSDSMLEVTVELKDKISHNGTGYLIESIVDHEHRNGEWCLYVNWLGFEELEDSWESLRELHQDDPAAVKRYLRSLKDEDETHIAEMWQVVNGTTE